MPLKLTWLPSQDHAIRRMRAEGATWDAVADRISVSRWSAIARGRWLGAAAPRPGCVVAEPERGEEPLAAGHPASWGAIIKGTLLEGAAWPAGGER